MQQVVDVDAVAVLADEPGHEHRPGQPGEEGAEAGARHADVGAVDEDGVEADVDDVHQEGGQHGYLAVAHGAEEGSAGIVDGKQRVRDGGEEEIGHGGLHHVILQVAEDQTEDGLPEEKTDGHGGG